MARRGSRRGCDDVNNHCNCKTLSTTVAQIWRFQIMDSHLSYYQNIRLWCRSLNESIVISLPLCTRMIITVILFRGILGRKPDFPLVMNGFVDLIGKFKRSEFTAYEAFCWMALSRVDSALNHLSRESEAYLRAALTWRQHDASFFVVEGSQRNFDTQENTHEAVQCYLYVIKVSQRGVSLRLTAEDSHFRYMHDTLN
jgi:hypothetical protein